MEKKKKQDNIFKAFFREMTDTIIGEIIVINVHS